MGPLHCPLCIGLALLSLSRSAAVGMLLVRMAGLGIGANTAPTAPFSASLPAP